MAFENDKTDIPEVNNSRRTFTGDKTQTSSKSRSSYVTKPVYLTHGSYILKVVTGSYVWWQTFDVDSKEQNINLDFLKYARRSITVHTSAIDSVSKKDISGITDFMFLNNNGKWVSSSELSASEFTNGRVWSIKASAKGYKTEEFELRIEWYQDELFISASLEPK